MENGRKNNPTVQEQLLEIKSAAIQVITRPNEFFRTMSKEGGFLPPLTFMLALGVATGLVHTLLSLFRLSPGGTLTGLAAVVLIPIVVAIFGFVSAAILFAIWKLMGSRESYETAYRGMAYTAAVMPITAALGIIPYLGGLIGLVWMTILIVVVSVEVHGIKSKTAWVTFGAICAFFAVTSLSAEHAGRKMVRGMEAWQQENQSTLKQLERLEDMTPEEAGKVMGEFLKGLQQTVEEKK